MNAPHTQRRLKLRAARNRRAVAAVEIAVISPILVVLTFGIVEVGWYVHLAQVVHNAARQGARAAVRLENSNAQVEAVVHDCLSSDAGINSSAATVVITRLNWEGAEQYQVMSLDENEMGEPVRVSVTVDYSQIGALTNMLGLRGGSLSSFAVMQRQN